MISMSEKMGSSREIKILKKNQMNSKTKNVHEHKCHWMGIKSKFEIENKSQGTWIKIHVN